MEDFSQNTENLFKCAGIVEIKVNSIHGNLFRW